MSKFVPFFNPDFRDFSLTFLFPCLWTVSNFHSVRIILVQFFSRFHIRRFSFLTYFMLMCYFFEYCCYSKRMLIHLHGNQVAIRAWQQLEKNISNDRKGFIFM